MVVGFVGSEKGPSEQGEGGLFQGQVPFAKWSKKTTTFVLSILVL